MIPRPEHEITGGDDDLLAPPHSADQHLGTEFGLQLLQNHPIQGRTRRQGYLRHFQPSLGEQLQLGGTGETQHPSAAVRRLQLRVNSHGKPQLLPQKQHLLEVVRIAHPGNDMPGAVFPGHDAAQNVEFIRGCQRHEQLRPGNARLLLHLQGSAGSADAQHIVPAGHALHDLRVVIHHGDFMTFLGQILCHCAAHLADTNHYDPHSSSLPFRVFACSL